MNTSTYFFLSKLFIYAMKLIIIFGIIFCLKLPSYLTPRKGTKDSNGKCIPNPKVRHSITNLV